MRQIAATNLRKGSIVKFKGVPSGHMRVVTIKGDTAIVEHLYKSDYRGNVVRTKPGKGVAEEVNIWELAKVKAVR